MSAVRRLGSRYVLHAPLGRGASGEVWRGSREADGSAVAVKILRAELTDDDEVVERFLRERRVLLGFDHPHLVKVRDLVAEGDTLAIVMDLIEGTDLRRYLRAAGGPLDPAAALALTDQVLDALATVHAQGVVHRDVKPENILVDATDPARPRAMLTDFGIARLTYGAAMTRRTGLIGTPRYMAPELSGHTRATPAADLYSLGVVLYELLRGRPPFDAEHPIAMLRAHLEQPPAPIEGLPATLWPTLARLLAKSPADRPATAEAARAELAATLPGTGTATGTGADGPGPTLAAAGAGAALVGPVREDTPGPTATHEPQPEQTVLSPRPDGLPPSLGELTSETALAPLTAALAGPTEAGVAGTGPADPGTTGADPAGTDPAGPRSRDGKRRRRLVWAGIAAAAVILTAGSWGIAAAVGGGKGQDRPAPLVAASAAGATVIAPTSAQDVVAADLTTASASGGAPVTTGPTGQANHAQAQPTRQAEPVDDGRAAIPDVRALGLDPAAAALKQAGFDNIPYLYDCYADSPAGTVVRQDPAAGTRAARTVPVHLYLEANNCATLPDVRGQRLDGAAAALRQAGATNIPYVYECLGSPNIGAVVSQSPAPGTTQIATNPVRLQLQADNC